MTRGTGPVGDRCPPRGILRDAFLGVRRFDDFVERLGSPATPTHRLDTLVATGILERCPYDEAAAATTTSSPTKDGALWPVMTALRQWGDQWIYGTGNADLRMTMRYDRGRRILGTGMPRTSSPPSSPEPPAPAEHRRRCWAIPRSGSPAPPVIA